MRPSTLFSFFLAQMDNQIVVSDYTQMDRVLREERAYILNLVKQIKKAGCNVLLIQKSILRDALSDLALHFLNKMKIMVVKDIEREDIEFICKVGVAAAFLTLWPDLLTFSGQNDQYGR